MKEFKVIWTFPKGFDAVSWVISTAFRVEHSHTLIVDSDGLVRESTDGKVQEPFDFSEKLKDFRVIKSCSIKIESQNYEAMMVYLNMMIGRKYPYLAAISTWARIGRWFKLGKDGDNKAICSELVAVALIRAKVLKDLEEPQDYVSPKDVRILLEKEGYTIKEGL